MSIERSIRPGWLMYWKEQIYEILAVSSEHLILHLRNCLSGEEGTERLEVLLLSMTDDKSSPTFAPNYSKLVEKVRSRRKPPNTVYAEDLPSVLLERADKLIALVETVERQAAALKQPTQRQAIQRNQTAILRDSLASLAEPVALATFYKYRAMYRQYRGERGAIAAAFRRSTYNQTTMNPAQLHFIDTLILRYYARQPAIRPSTLYRIAQSAWSRTSGQWIDPEKCRDAVPLDVVAELLNPTIQIQNLLNHPEKASRLTTIKLPSRSWVYQYLRWFEHQPEQGKTVITQRYGKAMWESEQMVFDSFVSHASLPLQYVFADHWLLDVFTVDESTRSQPTRLWLTLLLDAYSRCVLGMALLPESPNILSIQQALHHAIWPKTSHHEMGVAGDWLCFGIPQQLYLDNAWAHHSHSLEQLARSISQDGEYNSIDLVFRPPYKGRYGALIERFFGNLSAQVKQFLPGGILSNHPREVLQAVRSARLLYADIQRILHQLILTYHHTPHSELNGMTPHEKWQQGMAWGLAYVPPKTPDVEQRFWRLDARQRSIQKEGISAFGMHYWSLELAQAARLDRQGRQIMYRYRYNPADLSRIALFHEGQWVCEAFAKELRLPDGEWLALSSWEREMSKALARQAGQPTSHWLSFIHELEELSQQRLHEKQRIQRRSGAKTALPNAAAVEMAVQQTSPVEQDYTGLLTAFMSREERS